MELIYQHVAFALIDKMRRVPKDLFLLAVLASTIHQKPFLHAQPVIAFQLIGQICDLQKQTPINFPANTKQQNITSNSTFFHLLE